MVTVIFGVLMIVLLIALVDAWEPGAMIAAALLTAVSPAMVYYSRYYVHEMLLVCFTLGAIVFLWRWWTSGKTVWAALAGLNLGLMFATKETAVLAFMSMGGALALTLGWNRLRDGQRLTKDDLKKHLSPMPVAALVLATVVVAELFFSSFFSNLRGPLDSILAFTTYAERAGGEGSTAMHEKPWHYYLGILLWTRMHPKAVLTEALILGLAVVGVLAVLARKADNPAARFQRFVAFYAVLMTGGYSFIAYKTPWNLLSFLSALILMAGIGLMVIVQHLRWKPLQVAAWVLFLAGCAHLAKQANEVSVGSLAASPRNPFVYAHSSGALLKMVDDINAVAAVHPDQNRMVIKVVSTGGDYWPLPWYLRAYPHVGYWPTLPDAADGDVLIVSNDLSQALAEKLDGDYKTQMGSLRPGLLFTVYFEAPLWERFIETRE
jgi:uncharacterized protein (TIGR03663 family)